MPLWTLPLSFLAGVLTLLSPCVLPLVPVVVAGARAQDSRGPLALAAGMAATFGIVGGFLASLGVDFGGSPLLRGLAAALILLIGLALLFPAVAHRLEAGLAPLQRLADFAANQIAGFRPAGAGGGGRACWRWSGRLAPDRPWRRLSCSPPRADRWPSPSCR